jgi:UDP-galactopyranose mutase
VSTSIRDVVRPYGQQGLVRIGDTPDDFIAACEAAMAEDVTERIRQADAFLRQTSWDGTWAQMRHLIESALADPTKSARAAGAV